MLELSETGNEKMKKDKFVASVAKALDGINSGATIMVGGFGTAGIPNELLDGLVEYAQAFDIRDLTIVNNNAGSGEYGLAALLKTERVSRIICSYPRQADAYVFESLYKAGKIKLELVPQGNLAERIRAAGAGIGAFYCPTGYGTLLANLPDGSPKEHREINGKHYVLEYPIHADFALIKAYQGDRWGNLTYRKSARNFGPVMAMAARCTIASVYHRVELGDLDPESVITPGIFVDRLVCVNEPSHNEP